MTLTDGLPPDLPRLARLGGTLVFLMGLSRLPQLAARLMEEGLPGDTPAAVISGGGALWPAAVRAPLAELARAAQTAGVRPPAVIVVGGTAGMDLTSRIKKPLEGIRIGLTGTRAIQDKLRSALEAEGARVFSACTLVPEELPFTFDVSLLCRGDDPWVVLTSGNGVRIFFRRLAERGIDLRRLHRCRFAVIGRATAAALSEHGIQADLCPDVHTGAGLARALLEAGSPGRKAYLFRSAQGSRLLSEMLSQKYEVRDIPLYRLELERTPDPLPPDVGYLAFSSAGGVERFLEQHKTVPEGAVCVCIGEVTAQALARRYGKPFLIAPDVSAQGIVTAILGRQNAE